MVVSPIDHAVLCAAVREIAGGEVTLRPSTAPILDGSRLYGLGLADGDFARICIDADGAVDFTVFDRNRRSFVADLRVGPGGVAGTLGCTPIVGPLLCGGVDVEDLVSAMRDTVAAADGAVTFSYSRRIALAA